MADLVRRGASPAAMKKLAQDRRPRTEYLAFRLAGDVYAAEVSLVSEILKPPPLTPVPRAPYAIMGIISVRGQLVTVVDLRRHLRLSEPASTRRTRILLAERRLVDRPEEKEKIGLFVDEVLQVYRLAENEIEPAATALGSDVAGYITGIARPVRTGGGFVGLGRRGQESKSEESKPSMERDASVVILLDMRAVLASL